MAVIAILAAVAVPTSMYLVRKAEKEQYTAFVDTTLATNLKVEYDKAYGENKTNTAYLIGKIKAYYHEEFKEFDAIPVYSAGEIANIDATGVATSYFSIDGTEANKNTTNLNTFKTAKCATVYIKNDTANNKVTCEIYFYINGKYQDISNTFVLEEKTPITI